MHKITPFLWFDDQAEQAAQYYVSVFRNSRIGHVQRLGDVGPPPHPEGGVRVVQFELDGQPFTAMNAGPHFKFNEAVSLFVSCEDQAEVDYYWEKLIGDQPGRCGWLKDRWGLSWQIVPKDLDSYIGGPDPAGAARAMQAMLQMSKLDIAALKRAYEG